MDWKAGAHSVKSSKITVGFGGASQGDCCEGAHVNRNCYVEDEVVSDVGSGQCKGSRNTVKLRMCPIWGSCRVKLVHAD